MLRRPQIMGIVNVTPDSFSGDGVIMPEAALKYAEQLIADGADCLDLGAYSSRPAAPFVSDDEEISRLLPALRLIRRHISCPIFVDTFRANVANKALELGADGINTIYGLNVDDDLWRVLLQYPQVKIILMHNPLLPHSQTVTLPSGNASHPPHDYPNGVVNDAMHDLQMAINKSPIPRSRIMVDMGFGFGKSVADNIIMLQSLSVFATMGYPIVLGISRKSFLGEIIKKPPNERIFAGLSAMLHAAPNTAIIRTHDVEALFDGLAIWGEIAKQ